MVRNEKSWSTAEFRVRRKPRNNEELSNEMSTVIHKWHEDRRSLCSDLELSPSLTLPWKLLSLIIQMRKLHRRYVIRHYEITSLDANFTVNSRGEVRIRLINYE